MNFVQFSSEIPEEIRHELVGYCGFTCSMCGLAPGERDSTTGEIAYLDVSPRINKDGEGRFSNLEATCSICIEGRKEIRSMKPPAIWLLSQIRRAGIDEQREVLKWLRKKFKE